MTEYNKLEITLEDIDKIYAASNGINVPLIHEAVRQVELKIQNEDARKERIDIRAYNALKILLSAIGIIFVAIGSGYFRYPFILALASILPVISVISLIKILKHQPYAALGTSPHNWLNKVYLKNYEDGTKESKDYNEHVLGLALARILYAQEYTLKASHNSNERRLKLLNKAFKQIQYSFMSIILVLIIESTNFHHFLEL